MPFSREARLFQLNPHKTYSKNNEHVSLFGNALMLSDKTGKTGKVFFSHALRNQKRPASQGDGPGSRTPDPDFIMLVLMN